MERNLFLGVLLAIVLGMVAPVMPQELPAPENFYLERQARGDLDKDSIPEIAAVFYRPLEEEQSMDVSDRVIRIYKKRGKGWRLWRKSKWAILHSKGGGMMGDPLQDLRIEDGILIIKHRGGTSWKWWEIDRFRFQNNQLALIGNTGYYGKVGEYERYTDFNLSTGKIIFKKTIYKDENGNSIPKKVKKEILYRKHITINLRNRKAISRQIKTPKGYTLYF